MAYGDFVKTMAGKWSTTQADATRKLDALWAELESEILAGGKLSIRDLGTFHLKNVKPRMARNPKTGEPIQTQACKKIGFRSKKF